MHEKGGEEGRARWPPTAKNVDADMAAAKSRITAAPVVSSAVITSAAGATSRSTPSRPSIDAATDAVNAVMSLTAQRTTRACRCAAGPVVHANSGDTDSAVSTTASHRPRSAMPSDVAATSSATTNRPPVRLAHRHPLQRQPQVKHHPGNARRLRHAWATEHTTVKSAVRHTHGLQLVWITLHILLNARQTSATATVRVDVSRHKDAGTKGAR